MGYDIHGLVYKKPKGEIMKKSIIFFTILAVLVVGQITSAVAAIINFDDYSTGPLTFASSTRYQPLGAVFSRDIPIYSVAAVEANWWVEKFQAGGGTLPNVMALSSAVDPRLSIDMSFVVPGTTTPATIDFISALFCDSEVGSTIGLFEAFDIKGKLIASTSPVTPASSTAILQFSTPGIASVRFTDIDDGFEIDNITFNTPVATPLPPAFLLLMSGLGGLGITRYLRRRQR